ncbi:MAG: hypothetical protein ACFFAA_06425 [Promethearchaeota archaeon]
MNNTQVFNLEKIKKLTDPIEDLQTELNQLNVNSLKISENIQNIEHEFNDRNILSQITRLKELLQDVDKKLNNLSNTNLNKFLDFQNQLIKKYKDDFKENVKKLNINKDITKKIGLDLIENKKISKIIDSVSFIPSIEIKHWIELLDSLKYNTIFLKSIKRIQKYYQNLIQIKLESELSKIPEDIDSDLIRDYKNFFKENPTFTFNEFYQTIENQLTQKELIAKRASIERAKKKEELEKLKKKQEEQKTSYENYLKLSDREFERLRRKKTREKLTVISKKSSSNNSIKISDEVSEKIKKFKSQFDKSFKDKYMIQKDEDKDPIDLIRERKKKKEKEYKHYEDHFKNN